MSDPSFAVRRGAIPWGVIGACGLILLAESWVVGHDLVLSNRSVMSFAYALGAVPRARDADVIGLGDSLVKVDFVPRAVERRSGRKTYNLAVAGGNAPMTYFVLKRALDAGARPGAIVVSFKPTQLQIDPLKQVGAYAAALGLRECVELAYVARDVGWFTNVLLSRSLPSLRKRPEIQWFIRTSVDGQPVSNARSNLIALRNWDVNRGGWVLPKNPAVEVQPVYWDERSYDLLGDWSCAPLNAVFLRRVLVLAAARGVPVYWVTAPINPRVQARRDGLGYDRNYNRMLRRAVDQFPNLTVVDGRHSGYPTRVFVDGVHLDMEGAYALSEEVAGLIERGGPSPGSRLVELPRYRARAIPGDLENEEFSGYALFGGPRPVEPVFATVPGPDRR